MRFSNIKVKQKILVGIFSPLLLLVILAGTFIYALDQLRETEYWVEHTQKAMISINRTFTTAVNIETGMRGFLLTGKEDYLEPYAEGEKQVYAQLDELRHIVRDNPAQVARLWNAENILHDWQDNVTRPSIALRRIISDEKGIHDMAKLEGGQRSNVYTSRIQYKIDRLIEEERRLLRTRMGALELRLTRDDLRFDDSLEKVDGWTNRTFLVVNLANEIGGIVKDIDTALRGYLLSGTEELLEPYKQGEKLLEGSLNELALLVSDHPSQLRLLGEIRLDAEAWGREVIHPMVLLRQEISGARTMDDMAELVGRGKGKDYFDQFRQVMHEFKEEERRLMELRKAEAKNTTQWVYVIIVLCTLGSLAIGGGLAYKIGGNISRGITKMADAMRRLSAGETEVVIPGDQRKDEIGEMAFAARIFRKHLYMIERLSIEDELTGLYNRRKFNDDFSDELKRVQRDKKYLALMMMDVDCFKKYNDHYGHQEGDKVLKKIGVTIKKTFMRAGDFSYRLGGEEFGIIISADQSHHFKIMAERIRLNIEALAIPHAYNQVEPVVTASIGLMVVPYDAAISLEEIYKSADEALYRAKEAGRNRVEISWAEPGRTEEKVAGD